MSSAFIAKGKLGVKPYANLSHQRVIVGQCLFGQGGKLEPSIGTYMSRGNGDDDEKN